MDNKTNHFSIPGWVRKQFFPNKIVSSPVAIDFAKLATQGFRVVLLDIDNTLVCHGSHECDDFAAGIIDRVRAVGMDPIIVSNARSNRAQSFASSLDVEFIANARKPSTQSILGDLSGRQCPPHHAVMVGDQLLTDVWFAKKAGVPVILTEKRSQKEIITVRLKRILESLLIRLGGRDHWNHLYTESLEFPREDETTYDCK
ncbi:MAG TPA: YqeG family HAD IIIA-type phosphatase [Clostridia bacterium]|nr:YqeG family HAD IIIA-type phosphatase [Clostridia bacterium]